MTAGIKEGRPQLEKALKQLEYELARRSFRDFLKFVKVIEPGTGMVEMQVWGHLESLNTALETEKQVVLAKSRQIGITTDLAAYVLHHGMYRPNALAVVFSKGERDAWEFLNKSRATYESLPRELQEPLGQPSNREQMTFQRGSRIITLPSTESAGRGLNPTLVVIDEADYHQYLDACYNSVKPGLDDNKGQLIITSTVNPAEMGSLFQELWHSAPSNGFKKFFFGWKSRPGRGGQWYQDRRAEYPDKALFQKEHPETEEEAFAPAKALAAFDQEILRQMKTDVRDPVEQPIMGNGVRVNIYQGFQPGKRYIGATDTSHGTGKDFAVTVVLDVVTGYVAADITSAVLNPSELAVASVELLNSYDAPVWGIEDNDWGAVTIERALDLRYRRLYHRDEGKPGWHTYDSAGLTRGPRYVLWGDLIEAVEHRLITVPNEEGLRQFLSVVRVPEKHGRIEAMHGAHDDYPMAVGIAWQLRHLARPAAGLRRDRREHAAGGSRFVGAAGAGAQRRLKRW